METADRPGGVMEFTQIPSNPLTELKATHDNERLFVYALGSGF
jgi:hypothetical protein